MLLGRGAGNYYTCSFWGNKIELKPNCSFPLDDCLLICQGKMTTGVDNGTALSRFFPSPDLNTVVIQKVCNFYISDPVIADFAPINLMLKV
jgi:hypothetical protein